MIYFRTSKSKDKYSTFFDLHPEDKTCGIYDNGLIVHYGRELDDDEIARVRERNKYLSDLRQDFLFQRREAEMEKALDDYAEKYLSTALDRAVKEYSRKV